MIQQEEIGLKQFRTGVTFYIFSTSAYNNLPSDSTSEVFPTYVLYNNQNVVSSINFFDGNKLWARNPNNNFVNLSALTTNQYITGYTSVVTIDSDLSEQRINETTRKILDRLENSNSELTTPGFLPGTNYVFSEKKLIDDFYVDLKLERSYNSLDTFKIHNTAINSIPTQNSNTGVLFGRLTAIQKVKDESGENIKIPLKNVPIGVFNPSEEFPQIFSVDENGNRISLNFKETSSLDEYFNQSSYQQDQDFYLPSAESFSGIPSQYKYITKTNENGEYIIYDVPAGEQVVLFEIDLFKQGLTKDEIALNFFPFPTTEDPNIDSIPSFLFKQFPVDIVPAWGLTQTGYTNLNININLDLRKWATYILPPVSYSTEKLEVSTAKNNSRTLKVEVRDMTAKNFENKPVEIVQIVNDLDRDIGSDYSWFQEFTQRRNKIEFNKFGCNVFKLPANIYDPSSFKTDKSGNTTNNRGVWLGAYQIKASIGSVERTTGTIRAWNGSANYTKSHFYANYSFEIEDVAPSPPSNAAIGLFPYEKPWSINYPIPYSIPKVPTQLRFSNGSERLTRSNGAFYIKEPPYSDGDLVGAELLDDDGNPICGGFGLQNQGAAFFYNRIANVATRNFMYKYENGVSWNEKYANGFEDYWTPETKPEDPLAGLSEVLGGEKYQRVECGYGYFLNPEGWGRVIRLPNGADINLDSEFLSASDPNNPGPLNIPSGDISFLGNIWYYDEQATLTMVNLDNQNLSLALNPTSDIKKGWLNIYRIIESGLENIKEPTPFVIPTFVTLRTEMAVAALAMEIKNLGTIDVEFKNTLRGDGNSDRERNGVITYLSSSNKPPVLVGGTVSLKPNEKCLIYGNTKGEVFNSYEEIEQESGAVNNTAQLQLGINNTIAFTSLILPGNSDFNEDTNKYQNAIYEITVYYADFERGSERIENGLPVAGNNFIYPNITGYDPVPNNSWDDLVEDDGAHGTVSGLYNDTNDSSSIQIGKRSLQTQILNSETSVNPNNKVWRIRTSAYGHNNGVVHEGICRFFQKIDVNDENYSTGEDRYLYRLSLENSGSLWRNYESDGVTVAYGYYA